MALVTFEVRMKWLFIPTLICKDTEIMDHRLSGGILRLKPSWHADHRQSLLWNCQKFLLFTDSWHLVGTLLQASKQTKEEHKDTVG